MSSPERRVVSSSPQGWRMMLYNKGCESGYCYHWVLRLDCGHEVDYFSKVSTNRAYAGAPPTVFGCQTCGKQSEGTQEGLTTS